MTRLLTLVSPTTLFFSMEYLDFIPACGVREGKFNFINHGTACENNDNTKYIIFSTIIRTALPHMYTVKSSHRVLLLLLLKFIRSWVTGAAVSPETPRLPLLYSLPPAHPAEPQGEPRQAGIHSLSNVSSVFLRASSWLDKPGTPLLGNIQGHAEHMTEPPELNPLDAKEQQL